MLFDGLISVFANGGDIIAVESDVDEVDAEVVVVMLDSREVESESSPRLLLTYLYNCDCSNCGTEKDSAVEM